MIYLDHNCNLMIKTKKKIWFWAPFMFLPTSFSYQSPEANPVSGLKTTSAICAQFTALGK